MPVLKFGRDEQRAVRGRVERDGAMRPECRASETVVFAMLYAAARLRGTDLPGPQRRRVGHAAYPPALHLSPGRGMEVCSASRLRRRRHFP